MNKGIIREKKLVNNLFKNQQEFKVIEDNLCRIARLNSEVKVIPLTSQDNKRDNHTWDCLLDDGEKKVGVSIKTNNNKTTKHPQYKSLINHIFSQNKNKESYWLKEFENFEKETKEFLLEKNSDAKTLRDIRKDENNKTIKEIDSQLAKRYQGFFFNIFNQGLSSEESRLFLEYCFSKQGYLKLIWNDNDKFIIEDYLSIHELHSRELTSVEYVVKNNNIRLSFGNDLILEIRFKISFYKKYLVGGAVKSEINIKKMPHYIQKYSL